MSEGRGVDEETLTDLAVAAAGRGQIDVASILMTVAMCMRRDRTEELMICLVGFVNTQIERDATAAERN